MEYLSMCNDKDRQDKLELLYRKYRDRIYYWAFRLVKDKYKAEDVTHNVFLNLTKDGNLDRIKNIDDPETISFLSVITRNAAINEYRKSKQECMISITELNEHILLGRPDKELDRVLDDMCLSELISGVRKISSRYADVLIMKYVKQCEDKEIAAILQISEDNVRKRLQRGKSQLRKHCSNDRLDIGIKSCLAKK